MHYLTGIICTLILLITAPARAQQQTDSLLQATITVHNLHCDNDMPAIKKRLLNQDGIETVTFSERSGTASVFQVSYHNSAIDRQQIEKAIEGTPGCDDPASRPYQVARDKKSKKKRS